MSLQRLQCRDPTNENLFPVLGWVRLARLASFKYDGVNLAERRSGVPSLRQPKRGSTQTHPRTSYTVRSEVGGAAYDLTNTGDQDFGAFRELP